MINLGITADKMYEMLGGQVERRDLMAFQFPSKAELAEINAKSIYLGNYIKWDTKRQVVIIKKELGWQGQEVEEFHRNMNYEKIECRWQGIL